MTPTYSQLEALANCVDPDAAAVELMELLEDHTQPTVGWWARRLPPSRLSG